MKFGSYVSGNATRLLKATYHHVALVENIQGILHDGLADNADVSKLCEDNDIPYSHVRLDRLTGRKTGRIVSNNFLVSWSTIKSIIASALVQGF